MNLVIEITTPIFLGGSDARQLATLVRIPSIRGQVRYWLRAVLGRRVGNDVAALKTAENNLMGHTGASSLVRFQVQEGKQLLETADRYMLPHRQSGNKIMSETFAEKQRFLLSITPRPGLKTIPDEILAALLLWLNLGGLGKRARRGYGSLRCVRATAATDDVSPDKLALFTVKSEETLSDYLSRVLGWVQAAMPAQPLAEWPEYPILLPEYTAVLVSQRTYPSQQEQGTPVYEKAMVPFWHEFLRAHPYLDDSAYGYADRNGRRASPFHWHIGQTKMGYQWVFTTFWSQSVRQYDSRRNWQKVNDLLTAIADEAEGKWVWQHVAEVYDGR
ncbi:MAG: type III-B CRISPR module RAMP protein Cmr1 [Anaerolineales bacterium]|nr:type III-B CRISPR module RAMP protein Cmr1 [Anaerolineales bacterium]